MTKIKKGSVGDKTLYAKWEKKTYVVKFNNGKLCNLATFNLNISGGADIGGSESSSETGEGGDGCGSAIAAGVALPVIALSCVAIIKKKKERK